MDQTKINIDYCGKAELKKISARIAAQMGADIILRNKKQAA